MRSFRIALVALIVIPFAQSFAGPQPLFAGEELTYKVKYGFIRIGTVTVRTTRELRSGEPNSWHVAMTITSSVPFVNINEYSECMLNAETYLSHALFAKDESGGKHLVTRINYDERTRTAVLTAEDAQYGRETRRDTLRDLPAYTDAPTLTLFSRRNSQCGNVLTVPTLVDGHLGSTRLDFRHAVEEIEIGAWDTPIRVRRYDAHPSWHSETEGMSGDYTGWISDDDAAVPIRTEMKISVGSIRLELEHWKRGNWNPPAVLSASR